MRKNQDPKREYFFSWFGQTDPKIKGQNYGDYTITHSKRSDCHIFPLSNWTEKDIWDYINNERIPVVSLYFAKMRSVIEREGHLIMLMIQGFLSMKVMSSVSKIRFRTLGCYPLTCAKINASNLEQVAKEIFL